MSKLNLAIGYLLFIANVIMAIVMLVVAPFDIMIITFGVCFIFLAFQTARDIAIKTSINKEKNELH